jgi:mono/diheme cytochrome c family protein
MKTASIIATGIVASLASTPYARAQSADPMIGQRLAASVCVECHRIDADTPPKNSNAQAPSFVDVARLPSTTELAIKVFLRTPHANMPNLILSPTEIDSVAAYIVSLAPKR